MQELHFIKKFFLPLTLGKSSAYDLKDDAAVLDVPNGHQLAMSSDTLNAGTHFLTDSPPNMIAHKALRSNLSDLASMGARPLCYQLNIAFPEPPNETWLAAFTDALLSDQKHYDIYCSGGDTTSIKGGHLSISITALGLVDQCKAWRRGHAQDGDILALSDTVGDAWIGLQILLGKLKTADDVYFIDKYYKPPVRFVDNIAINAAVDISDGLIADIGHICTASNLGVDIDLKDIPFSPQAQKLIDKNVIKPEQLITGGDDYVLAMTLPRGTAHNFHEIGVLNNDKGVRIFNNDQEIQLSTQGWQHF